MGAGASNSTGPIKQHRCCPFQRAEESSPAVGSPTRTTLETQQGGAGVWSYEEFPGEWRDYDAATSCRLDDTLMEGTKQSVEILIKGRLHTITLSTMQELLPNGVTRCVRRTTTAKAFATGSMDCAGTTPLQKSTSIVDPFAVENVDDQIARTLAMSQKDANHLRPTLLSTISAHEAAVFASAFGLAGDKIVTGSKDGTFKYWELQTSFVLQGFEEHPGAILSCAINTSNQSMIASGCEDRHARIFCTNDPHPKHVLEGHSDKVYSVNFSNDGKHLLSASMDGYLRQWDVCTGQCVKQSMAHISSIFNLQVGPLSPWFVITASDDKLLAAHDLRLSNTVTHRFVGHEKTLWGCDIRYDEGQLLSCGMDCKVMAWDPRNPSGPYNTISSHRNAVHCVEYMPDGHMFLSSARDQTFRLSIASTGREVLSCLAHDANVYKVSFNAATQTVMSCGSDAYVKLWSLPNLVE